MSIILPNCPSCRNRMRTADGMESSHDTAYVCDNTECSLYGLYVQPLPAVNMYSLPFGGHELGKTYWCGYWREAYTVTATSENRLDWVVKSHWHGDKRITVHSTPLDPKWDCLITGSVHLLYPKVDYDDDYFLLR